MDDQLNSKTFPTSSFLRWATYDIADQVLTLQLREGDLLVFHPVSRDAWNELQATEAVDEHVQATYLAEIGMPDDQAVGDTLASLEADAWLRGRAIARAKMELGLDHMSDEEFLRQ